MSAALPLTVVLVGLLAGLFAAFSYAVMPGLRRADDAAMIAAMRGINAAIANPVFAVIFLGPLITGGLVFLVAESDVMAHVVVGYLLYLATLAITLAVNVPLNTQLETDGQADAVWARARFEARWVRWNHARTLVSLGSFVAYVWALAA